MSDIQNRKKLNPKYNDVKKVLLAVLTFCGMFLFPIPSLTLISFGMNLRPRRIRWILYGILGIIGTLVSIPLFIAFNDVPFFLIPQLLSLIYILKMRVVEEYVIRYNALIDSGYFVAEARRKAANLQRHEDEILAEAKRNAEKLSPRPKGKTVVRHAQPVQQPEETPQPQAAPESPFAQVVKQPEKPEKQAAQDESPFAHVVKQRATSAKQSVKLTQSSGGSAAAAETAPPENDYSKANVGRKLDL